MRIAFVVHAFPELSETFILRQVTGLLDRGHDVRIFAWRAPAPGPVHEAVAAYDLPRRVRVLPHRTDPLRAAAPSAAADGADPADGAGPARLGRALLASLRPEHAHALGGWRTLLRTVARLAAEPPYDVVHGHYGHVALRYRVAARVWRAPLVASFYGHDASEYPRAHGDRVFAALFREAGAVTSLSAHMDARLRALGCPDARLRRVPLAVDPDAFRPTPRASRPGEPVRVLTVARLIEKKGIAVALRALALLGDDLPRLRYDVVGDGPLRPELEALARALGLADRVRFLGARTGDEVRAALAAADLFLLPSATSAGGDEEGTPTVLLEAAACGLPVLSTRHAGIPELVLDGESGLLVPEHDPAALADGLRRLLRMPERWAAMGAAGRRHVAARHGTAAVAARLEEVYAELATGAPADVAAPAR